MKRPNWPDTGKSNILLQYYYEHLLEAYGLGAALKFAFHNGVPKPRVRVKAWRDE